MLAYVKDERDDLFYLVLSLKCVCFYAVLNREGQKEVHKFLEGYSGSDHLRVLSRKQHILAGIYFAQGVFSLTLSHAARE